MTVADRAADFPEDVSRAVAGRDRSEFRTGNHTPVDPEQAGNGPDLEGSGACGVSTQKHNKTSGARPVAAPIHSTEWKS